jgi:acyl carrier protein
MSNCQQAKELLAEAANCDSAMIPDEVRIGTFERWDSLAHLRLVLKIEQQIGRQLDPDEAVRIESLAYLAALLAPAGCFGKVGSDIAVGQATSRFRRL